MHILSSILFVFFICTNFFGQYKVILSSRSFHPDSEKDTLNTMKAIENFNVEQVDWMYCDSEKKLSLLTEKKIPFSLAINPMLPDSLGFTRKNRVLDIEGKPIIVPWMKNWKKKNLFWGCVNTEGFYELFVEECKEKVDLKCYGIFVDDAKMNLQFSDKGGCFCNDCMIKFGDFLKTKNLTADDFNYKTYLLDSKRDSVNDKKYFSEFNKFQKKSVMDFHQRWMEEISTYSDNKIKFLTNNYGGIWDEIYSFFDIGIGEINENKHKLEKIDQIKKTLILNNKKQYLAFASKQIIDNYKFILHSYFNGIICILPWDHLLDESYKNVELKRFYSKPEELNPIINLLKEVNLKECDSLTYYKVLKNLTIKEKIKYIKVFEEKDKYYVALYNDLKENDNFKLKISSKKYKTSILFEDLFKTKITKFSNGLKVEGNIILIKFQKK